VKKYNTLFAGWILQLEKFANDTQAEGRDWSEYFAKRLRAMAEIAQLIIDSPYQPNWPDAPKGLPCFKYTSVPGDQLKTFYSIECDDSHFVEVIGDPGFASYEWIIREGAKITLFSDVGYGSSSKALADGLAKYHA